MRRARVFLLLHTGVQAVNSVSFGAMAHAEATSPLSSVCSKQSVPSMQQTF